MERVSADVWGVLVGVAMFAAALLTLPIVASFSSERPRAGS
jgi:hypothetical protein